MMAAHRFGMSLSQYWLLRGPRAEQCHVHPRNEMAQGQSPQDGFVGQGVLGFRRSLGESAAGNKGADAHQMCADANSPRLNLTAA